MGQFKLGKNSLKELDGVHSDLVAVVKKACELSVQEFSVHDGLRSLAQQKALLARGATTTLNSKHLTGHAVDLVPVINGKLRWEWPPIYDIAESIRTAAMELGVPVRWGGAWDVIFTESKDSPEDIVTDYVARRKAAGKRAFIDGPHFELMMD